MSYSSPRLKVVEVTCAVCHSSKASLVGTGYDYEYQTSSDLFYAFRCQECGSIYLNPRPDVTEFERIYPPEYHSLEFTDENFSFVHNVRAKLESRRLLRYCEGVLSGGRILDVGCGDGFHMGLLKQFGNSEWSIEGIDIDPRAVEAAQRKGLMVHHGDLSDARLDESGYDVVYTLQTIEHVADPGALLRAILVLLKPGGRLVIVTDNTETADFRFWKAHFWGGYHFPRHWNLFNRMALSRLANDCGFEVEKVDTIVSPVNWVYSIHNYLVAKKAPNWLIARFSLASPISLAAFTLVDTVFQKFGRGALLNAFLVKPE